MDWAFYISAFVTIYVIIDPIGLTPLFVTMTRGMTARKRHAIGLRALLIGFVLLALFGVLGKSLLGFVGISMPAFRIAGGVLLFLTALDMLFERRAKRREGQTEDDNADPSVFPLATPLIAGPGAITTMILLTGQLHGDVVGIVLINLVLAAVLAIVGIMFLAAGLLERALGPTGINVISRILGMLLAALSVQFVLDGVRAVGFLPG